MATTHSSTRADIYSRVTSQIIEQLERGTRPWLKPWNAEHVAGRISRPLRHNGQKYSGINVITLWMSAEMSGFVSPFWLTFNQARELGAFVKKGEHGSPVVYASKFTKKDKDDAGDEIEQEIPFLKEYTVFNADQISELPSYFYELANAVHAEPLKRIEQAETFFANTKADIRYGGDRAYYACDADYIRMPPLQAFRDAESHAATLAHELTHWTKHTSRLNRDFGRKRFADEGYSMEELVAELGSAFLAADLRITPEVREDHASYIANWLEILKSDKRAVFSAASFASRAVEFLHALQPQSGTDIFADSV